jgi:hypothetical protein
MAPGHSQSRIREANQIASMHSSKRKQARSQGGYSSPSLSQWEAGKDYKDLKGSGEKTLIFSCRFTKDFSRWDLLQISPFKKTWLNKQ